MNIALGYHGTTKSRAQKILGTGFEEPPGTQRYRWLGRGAYFFQDSPGLAKAWAESQSNLSGDEAIVLEAQIDLTGCMDLVADREWIGVLQAVHSRLRGRLDASGKSYLDQKPLEIKDGRVVVRPISAKGGAGSATVAGLNFLDFAVVEMAIEGLRSNGINIESVRACFLEGAEIYPNSWMFDAAHTAIVVRPPYDRIKALSVYSPPMSVAVQAIRTMKHS